MQANTTREAPRTQQLEDFWDDVLNVAVNVAQVAVNVLPQLILGAVAAENEELFSCGPVAFGVYENGDGTKEPFVRNTMMDTDYLLVMAQPSTGETPTKIRLPSASGDPSNPQYYDVPLKDTDFSTYVDGSMAMAPLPSAAPAGVNPITMVQTILRNIRGDGQQIPLTGGYTLIVSWDADQSAFKFKITGSGAVSATVSFENYNSLVFQVQYTFGQSPAADDGWQYLPDDMDLNPAFDAVVAIQPDDSAIAAWLEGVEKRKPLRRRA